jgi:hypothetical protein
MMKRPAEPIHVAAGLFFGLDFAGFVGFATSGAPSIDDRRPALKV